MLKSNVYHFDSVEELKDLSIKYVQFLFAEEVIEKELYLEYSSNLALREKCECPQCKGEYSRAREYFSFQERLWEPLWGKEKSEKSLTQ